MAKLGAILAQGIIDAGGRNMTVTLQSRTGHTNMLAVVGMLVSIILTPKWSIKKLGLRWLAPNADLWATKAALNADIIYLVETWSF